jgi:hypothetical protein
MTGLKVMFIFDAQKMRSQINLRSLATSSNTCPQTQPKCPEKDGIMLMMFECWAR